MIIELNLIMLYIIIFIAKIVEFAIITLRTILMARDEKIVNTLLCFVQMTIWVLTTGSVITNITTDPFRAIAYIAGCAVGCYVGMILDEKLAIGENMITAIVDEESGKKLIKLIREKGYAVTVLQGKGKEKERLVLMIATKRKKERKLVGMIESTCKEAMIINESITTRGGYL